MNALVTVPHKKVRRSAGQSLATIGEPLSEVFSVVRGLAVRRGFIGDRAQVLSFIAPGDNFDTQALVGARCDHDISALTDIELLVAHASDVRAAMEGDANLMQTFFWAGVHEASLLRQQVVRLGLQSARQRCAHVLLELYFRSRLMGMPAEQARILPLPREALADTLGLSAVHLSRSISMLKAKDLVKTSRRVIHLLDVPALVDLAEFDDRYLRPTNRLIWSSPKELHGDASPPGRGSHLS